MIRTQISLTPAQTERLRRVARSRGMSMAAVIREAIDAVVPDEDTRRRRLRQRLASAAGSCRPITVDPPRDVHDEWADAVWDEFLEDKET